MALTRRDLTAFAAAVTVALGGASWTAADALPRWQEHRQQCATMHAYDRAQAAVADPESPVVVVGDSYAHGMGLDDPTQAWSLKLGRPVQLHAQSGAGFTRDGMCSRSLLDLAGEAKNADVLVVQGGLNDVTAEPRELRKKLDKLPTGKARRVVLVGPAAAPARAAKVPQVEATMRDAAARHGWTFVSLSGLDLPYQDDQLHVTSKGHQLIAETVAAAIR